MTYMTKKDVFNTLEELERADLEASVCVYDIEMEIDKLKLELSEWSQIKKKTNQKYFDFLSKVEKLINI